MRSKIWVFILSGGIGFFSCLILCFGFFQSDNDDKYIFSDEHVNKGFSKAISMMYETSASSGVYEEGSGTSWPESGYTFNSTLSKCENGSTLTWDESTKKVQMKGNVSDKCYVYFDKRLPLGETCNNQNLASCLKENYELDSNLLYHDANLTNGAGDGSYRYSGSYESVNNYVCFGSNESKCPHDNLYRIIGVFGNQVKLIKADYAKSTLLGTNGDYKGAYSNGGTNKGSNTTEEIGGYYWNYNDGHSYNSNIWANSKLNKENLNGTYLNSFSDNWRSKIAFTTWKVGGNFKSNIMFTNPATAYQNEIVSPASGQPEVTKRIGLMYVCDYYYGSSPENWTKYGYTSSSKPHSSGNYGKEYEYSSAINDNWMYGGLYEWTISRQLDGDIGAFIVYYDGNVFEAGVYIVGYAVRPVFYLESSVVKTTGSGSASDPMRLQV